MYSSGGKPPLRSGLLFMASRPISGAVLPVRLCQLFRETAFCSPMGEKTNNGLAIFHLT